VEHNEQRSRELRISLGINTSLIISYKNQPFLLALRGCLEEKNRQIYGA